MSTKLPTREEIATWVWPTYFEPYPRVDKCKPRSGETRRLRGIINKAKEQGIIIVAEFKKFEEDVSGTHYIFNTNTGERLTPKFKTASKCIDMLADFLEL